MEKYRINEREYVCPLQLALNVVLGKWKGLIIWILLYQSEVKRYGELKKEINQLERVTDRMLIQSLKELEEDAIIQRKAYPVVPPKVEYRLTEAGKRLKPVIDALEAFGVVYEVKG
ncbi:MAG: helix-turn-helix transcriptional regulator [Chloroflexota bacterium]|nr:helix-turn-helix transcriptional regulator [Chloroflexota bacterium]MDQ5866126.1 helix-turn-helix transcriptional regulator [Chloroflexota bacterium]